ncbi:MAG TPA: hypothetical protein VI248_08430 [Kineosporiaceae bacterium]
MTGRGGPLRIDQLPPGEIHAVGAAGLETASMVRYLVEGGREDIVLHDLADDVDAAFAAAHRFQPADHRARSLAARRQCRDLRTGRDHLGGIERAAAVLLPVSWFLHPANAALASMSDRWVTYPDACFDLWRGPVIGVTGSFGKTTTTCFAAELSDGVPGGNDRESFTDLAALAAEPAGRVLTFEISNRHLRNGFRRTLDVGVLTGIALNHEPDHGSFAAYRKAKYSIAARSHRFVYHAGILERFPDAQAPTRGGVSYGQAGGWSLAGDLLCAPDGTGYPVPGVTRLSPLNQDDATAAAAAVLTCGVPAEDVERRSLNLHAAAPRYRQSERTVADRVVVNDSSSCMPASTAALVAVLDVPFVLICGGDRQLYRAGEFGGLASAVRGNPHAVRVCTTGPMSVHLADALHRVGFDAVSECADLVQAVRRAVDVPGAAIVLSPGCGTGALFGDKYERGDAFDHAVATMLSRRQAMS